jgi:L-ascorbate metabolism protein UlaG (beta-lactamase superfamily)
MIFFILITGVALFIYAFLQHPKFGRPPLPAQQNNSSNYRDGKFHNQSFTPELTEGTTMIRAAYEHVFKKSERRRPVNEIPSLKTNLHNLNPAKNIFTWFGHSSYFLLVDGIKMLIDPVFSGNASPIPGTNTSFKGSDRYQSSDLPEIDILFITHDHYDHADYLTLKEIRSKVKQVICGLGVGAHLRYWGYENISELDWYDSMKTGSVQITATPARHFSGRSLKRNQTLWVSFAVQLPSMNIYIGGDSGYDDHFKETGERFGPFDLAILDNGQYDRKWKYIHMHPEEVLMAAQDLKAGRVIPVHSSKFVMANHPWDEPLKAITELNKKYRLPLITPRIGEEVNLSGEFESVQWWDGLS